MVWYLSVGMYIWELFNDWLRTIFVTPVQNIDMLWLLVPIWIAWFFAEFFQEKGGTSMGNALTNSVVILWGSVDCTRQTLNLIAAGTLTNTFDIALRFALIALIFVYGGFIVWLGWNANPIIKYIGRVREVTYVFAMFVPIFYNAIPFSVNHLVAAILFFPLFYFLIELLDRYTPNPKAFAADLQSQSSSPDFSSSLPSLDSGSSSLSSSSSSSSSSYGASSNNKSFNNNSNNNYFNSGASSSNGFDTGWKK